MRKSYLRGAIAAMLSAMSSDGPVANPYPEGDKENRLEFELGFAETKKDVDAFDKARHEAFEAATKSQQS